MDSSKIFLLIFIVDSRSLLFMMATITMLYICCKVISFFHIHQIFEYKLLLSPPPRLLSFFQVLFFFPPPSLLSFILVFFSFPHPRPSNGGLSNTPKSPLGARGDLAETSSEFW